MRNLLIVSILGLLLTACATLTPDTHRFNEGVYGAVAGGVVAGPPGAVVGGIIGYRHGPQIVRGWRHRNDHD
jgi:hypothetical protein